MRDSTIECVRNHGFVCDFICILQRRAPSRGSACYSDLGETSTANYMVRKSTSRTTYPSSDGCVSSSVIKSCINI